MEYGDDGNEDCGREVDAVLEADATKGEKTSVWGDVGAADVCRFGRAAIFRRRPLFGRTGEARATDSVA
jgi:hypothetical protein